jgi:hypothetical protein
MFRQSRGGFLTSSYLRRAAAPTVPRVTKREAYVLAARREGNFRMTLSSLHFVPEFDLRSRYLSNFYRSKWSREAAASLRWRFPDRTAGHLFVIGGDFNSPRCLNRIAANCRRAPFWRTLTSRYRMYDAMYTYGRVAGHSNVQTNAGVDYIFSTGSVFAAGSDATYTKQVRRQPGRFYSDHQFYWALVGPATRP